MRRFIKMESVVFAVIGLLIATTQCFAYDVEKVWSRFSATAGETLTKGQAVALKDSDGYAYKADADSAAIRPAVGIVGKGGTSGQTVEIITCGILSGWTSLSEGTLAYLSETAGAVTQSAPAWSQPIGVAISTTKYYVNCQNYFDSSSLTAIGTLAGATPIILEGATADAYETTIAPTDPTADRTLTLPDASGIPILSAAVPDGANAVSGTSNGLVYEGATADAYETTVSSTDPTADRSIVLPNAPGTVMLSSLATNGADAANAVTGASNGLVYEGATADAYETTVTPTDPTADRTVTLPDASGTVDVQNTTSHDYAAGHADWSMTAAEAAATVITVTNADSGANAILPAGTAGKLRVIYNNSGQTITFKVTGQSGGTIANAKKALYYDNGTDIVELYEQP